MDRADEVLHGGLVGQADQVLDVVHHEPGQVLRVVQVLALRGRRPGLTVRQAPKDRVGAAGRGQRRGGEASSESDPRRRRPVGHPRERDPAVQLQGTPANGWRKRVGLRAVGGHQALPGPARPQWDPRAAGTVRAALPAAPAPCPAPVWPAQVPSGRSASGHMTGQWPELPTSVPVGLEPLTLKRKWSPHTN